MNALPWQFDRRIAVLTVGVLILSASPGAEAQELAGFELTPFGGYRMGGQIDTEDSDLAIKLDDSASFGLLLNWPARDNTEWELHYSTQQTDARITDALTDTETRVDFETHVAQIGGTYLFEGNNTVIPYLAMTLGGTYVRTPSDSDTFFSGSIGLGIKVFPSARVGLRLEARGYGTLVSSSSRIFCTTSPDISGCAIELKGDLVSQVETFAGITVRF